jgi:uncharacterized protein (TIGR01777 family)
MAEPGALLVSGATGLVGRRLLPHLIRDGYVVRCLSRDPTRAGRSLPAGAQPIGWDGLRVPPTAVRGCAAAIHLAGEPVFGGIPTAARRARIRESRVASTTSLAAAIGALPAAERPGVLLCASAVGYYGSRGEEVLDEGSSSGEGFLAAVCRAWEDAARGAERHGVRVVRLRIGIVLAREGGALPSLALPFRLGLGGPLGDGRQWVPWIHAEDLIALLRSCLADSRAEGAVNAVSPAPARNAELASALGRVLHRPTLLRVPAFVIRAALGEMAGELLGSRRVVPRRAQALGVRFRFHDLEAALAAELRP